MKGRWESNMNVWFPFLYSHKWNCYFQTRIIMFCLPVPTLIYLWEIYIFPGPVCLFCCRKYVDRSWECINRSHTHECGNWDWGRAIPRKGIQCSVAQPVARRLAVRISARHPRGGPFLSGRHGDNKRVIDENYIWILYVCSIDININKEIKKSGSMPPNLTKRRMRRNLLDYYVCTLYSLCSV